MPIFYNPDLYRRSSKRVKRATPVDMARRPWEEDEDEGGNTDDGDVKMEDYGHSPHRSNGDTRTKLQTSDRGELIESIKRGESPTWIPNRALEVFFTKNNGLYTDESFSSRQPPLSTSQLLPPLEVKDRPTPKLEENLSSLSPPEDIERPRSALHSGDFRERNSQQNASTLRLSTSGSRRDTFQSLGSSPTTPWFTQLQSTPYLIRPHAELHSSEQLHNGRSRAPSLGSSRSSSFVMRAPTSPLVHSANNTDFDSSSQSAISSLNPDSDNRNRRRTLPPETFRSLQASPYEGHRATNFSRPLPALRRDSSLPYQAHQPRRSLTSFNHQSLSSPQTPTFLRSRRPSLSDVSPIQHASMVGSFEESILRGRMSTAPSKPLDFVAQIGVLGKGDCKPSLRCPAHVTVPFPAVFYSYASVVGSRSIADDSPSPYVGSIDLEHSLKPIETRKHRKRHISPSRTSDDPMRDLRAPENTPIGLDLERKKRGKRRRSLSPRAPLGGCYRVPQQGQLQIVIKNPNKTAVKLYLVPYNLEGMEPGTKTFVRQRSFSAGPIIEKPLTDKPQHVPLADPLKDKHVLRYLIHLKFCCPYKGHFYLYDNIRVVFANRVPDGKEKLRNEIQLPEPQYSPYKPGKEPSIGSAGAKLALDKAFRRSPSGFGPTSQGIDAMDGIASRATTSLNPAIIPFHITARADKPLSEREPNQNAMVTEAPLHPVQQFHFFGDASAESVLEREQTVSPTAGFNASTSARGSPVPWGQGSSSSSSQSFSPALTEVGEGLLARKLRSLEVQRLREEQG